MNSGAQQQHRAIPRQVYYPPPGSTAAVVGGAGGIPAVSVLGHGGYQPHPESGGHAMRLGLPPVSVPIVSILSPTLFSPYAVLTQIPVQRRVAVANGGGGGGGGGGSNGNSSVGAPVAAGGVAAGANGNANVAGGTGRDVSGSRNGSGNGIGNGNGGGHGNGNGIGKGGGMRSAHVRVRVHAPSLGPDGLHMQRKPRGLVVMMVAPGSTPDNRTEVMARAPALEKKRRVEGRIACQAEALPIPDIDDGSDGDIGVDFGDFRARKREDEEGRSWGPREDTGPVLRGWDDCDVEGASSGSCTGTISSVERADGGWCGMSSSFSSSSEDVGGWTEEGGGSASGSGSVSAASVSASGSACGGGGSGTASTMSDGTEEEGGHWPEDLKSSVGVVTDLVLPCHAGYVGVKRGAGIGGGGSGGISCGTGSISSSGSGSGSYSGSSPSFVGCTWEDGSEEDDEEEREMAAALEVRLGWFESYFWVSIEIDFDFELEFQS